MNTRTAIIISLFAFLPFSHAQALPPIVFYNFTPAAPVLGLVSIKPDNHQELSASPGVVIASFSAAIDATQSEMQVFDPYNNVIAKNETIDKDNAMKVTLPAKLLSGTYRVDWKVSCSCADHTMINGTTYFTID